MTLKINNYMKIFLVSLVVALISSLVLSVSFLITGNENLLFLSNFSSIISNILFLYISVYFFLYFQKKKRFIRSVDNLIDNSDDNKEFGAEFFPNYNEKKVNKICILLAIAFLINLFSLVITIADCL